MTVNSMYPAQGLTIVDGMFSEQFFLGVGEATFQEHVIEAGQVLKAGSVLGQVTASFELKLSDPAAGDGSEVPMAVLLEPLDTTAAADEVSVLVAATQQINFNTLVYPAGWNKNQLKAALRANSLRVTTALYSGKL